MIAVLKYALLLALLASVSVEASRKIQKVVAQPGRASLVSAKGSAKASLDTDRGTGPGRG